jgi:hypothetical protein
VKRLKVSVFFCDHVQMMQAVVLCPMEHEIHLFRQIRRAEAFLL